MEQRDSVVLVDECGHNLFNQDGRLSTMEKIKAHRCGLLHRAVSVFIFNDRNELLLQKRALDKYHSPGKWTNTCCTHPSPGESPLIAAQRRIGEEMGLGVTLTSVFSIKYDVLRLTSNVNLPTIQLDLFRCAGFYYNKIYPIQVCRGAGIIFPKGSYGYRLRPRGD